MRIAEGAVRAVVLAAMTACASGQADQQEGGPAREARAMWVRPVEQFCRWGIRGGIQFAVWPSAVGAEGLEGGPRGLIRVGYPVLPPDNAVDRINFIAIEPIVAGVRCYSELEPSATDGRPGKLIWPAAAGDPREGGAPQAVPGEVTHPDPDRPGIEELTVRLNVERFVNGAHVHVLVSMRSDHPDLLGFQVFAEPDSAPVSTCVLTATMGNFERLRLLHLRDRVVGARDLYGGYQGDGFAPDHFFPLTDLARTRAGDVVVAATK